MTICHDSLNETLTIVVMASGVENTIIKKKDKQ